MDKISEMLLLTTRIWGYLNSVLNSILSLYMSIFEILITNTSKSVTIQSYFVLYGKSMYELIYIYINKMYLIKTYR